MIAGATITINFRRAERLEEIAAEKIRLDAEKAAAEEWVNTHSPCSRIVVVNWMMASFIFLIELRWES